MNLNNVNRDLSLIAWFIRDKAEIAIKNANDDGFNIKIFEAWRSPSRQNAIYAQGRTSPGKIVTKARGWQSWHQYGLAIDIAFMQNGKWSWDGPFDKIKGYFLEAGLKGIGDHDPGHFEVIGKFTIDKARPLVINEGIQALWYEIESQSHLRIV